MKSSVALSLPAFRYLKTKWSSVASRNHPRISGPMMEADIYREEHAAVALDRYASFSLPWYDTADKQARIAYQGNAMVSVLNVVSQTQMVAIAPRWLADEFADKLALQILPLPLKVNSRTCYLSSARSRWS